MSNKISFVLFNDIRTPIETLSNEDAGQLFKAILQYQNGGKIKTLSPHAEMAFSFIKQQMDRSLEKYKEMCSKNRENAMIRWHKTDATACDRMRPIAKHADSDPDLDPDLDPESKNKSKKVIVLSDDLDKALKKWLRDGFLKLNDDHFSNYQKEAIAVSQLIKKAKNVAGKGDLQDFLRGMIKAFIAKKKSAKTEYWKSAPLLPSALNQRWDQVYELARVEARETEEINDPLYQMFIKGVGK